MNILNDALMDAIKAMRFLFPVPAYAAYPGTMSMSCRDCSGSCSGSCAGRCEYSCAGDCEVDCGGRCENSCSGFCENDIM